LEELKSEHYVFHVCSGSYALEHIQDIISLQESGYDIITETLGVVLPYPIHYHLFDTAEDVGKACNDEPCNGIALYRNESEDQLPHIYAVYNERVQCIGPHEDAHIVSFEYAYPKSVFLREGLAMFFDRQWRGIENTTWALFDLENNSLPSLVKVLTDDMFHALDCSLTYPMAGAFAQFLVNVCGKEKWLDFYKRCEGNIEEACVSVFGMDVQKLEQQFHQYLLIGSVGKELKDLMRQMRA